MDIHTLYQDTLYSEKEASLYSPIITGRQGRLLGTLYTAGGKHLHPVVVLAHGFPGHEKSLDLAQALRRAGFHVLFFSYSGSWGSPGTYSFQNSLDDTSSVLNFILSDQTFGFDKNQIFFIGHSLGCVSAAYAIAAHPEVKGGAFIMPCDLGKICMHSHVNKEARSDLLKNLEEGLPFLSGATLETLIDELDRSPELFSFLTYIDKLASKPLLWISSKTDPIAPEQTSTIPFMTELKKYPDSKVCWKRFSTDHYFSNKRVQITLDITNFLLDNIEHSKATINYASFKEELAELIKQQYKTLTLKEVASYFHLSTSHTSSLIKQQTGQTLSGLLLDEKMLHAQTLLVDTSLSITQIAAYLGYKNDSYFMMVFKKYFGCTPSQYRLQKSSSGRPE
ncbi:hypothetical protein C0033_14350 [Clostridium sp. chh4-2]|uniref:alpha/beta fold hydrolase n=1 Tax=Clostridium sp. chh4-2 TaxID=2067550 RepID=UPI000CCE3EF1|nr:alpha/beta fold hydrolase [Clostridium sp. chh4-2]PNV61465.1 hypothetical protein C0033_14350 [Clostridium sp. chh4-2]